MEQKKEVIESILLDDLIKVLKGFRERYGNSYVFKADNKPFQTSSQKEFDIKTFKIHSIKNAVYDYENGVIIK